jgi:hypothetical protein
MTARSTNIFPRENFELGAALEVQGFGGGTPDVIGNLKYVNTIKVVAVGITLTGNAELRVIFDSAGSLVMRFTAGDVDRNGVFIGHMRGTRLRNRSQDVGYELVPNTGSAGINPNGGVYLETL